MKKFILKCVLFLLLIGGLFVVLLSRYGGYADYFYVKFTTPKQQSMILGDSRSMQGILPSVADQSLRVKFATPVYNYSFTLGQIAYGPAYLESIKRKLDTNAKNGIFILNVSPWILAERELDDAAHGKYFETDMPPHNMTIVDQNPNVEYLWRNYEYFHFKAIFRKVTQTHPDGWLEQKLPSDPNVLAQWKQDLLVDFTKKTRIWRPSAHRMQSLEQTVAFLSQYGKVGLVRMPVDDEVSAIENQFWPDFDANVQSIAHRQKTPYWIFGISGYKTYDGNHLDNASAVQFTRVLCDSIKNTSWRP